MQLDQPSVFAVAPAATLALMKACRLAAEKSAIGASRTRPGPPSCTSTAPATSILPSALAPLPAGRRISLGAMRIPRSRRSRPGRPAASGGAGHHGLASSLAASSQADLYGSRDPVASAVAARRSRWSAWPSQMQLPIPDARRSFDICVQHASGSRKKYTINGVNLPLIKFPRSGFRHRGLQEALRQGRTPGLAGRLAQRAVDRSSVYFQPFGDVAGAHALAGESADRLDLPTHGRRSALVRPSARALANSFPSNL